MRSHVLLALALVACPSKGSDSPPIDSTECSPVAAHLEALGCAQAVTVERQCRRQLGNGLPIDLACLRASKSCQEASQCR